MRCSRCGATEGVRPYVARWPRKEFLCRAHSAAHFKAKRREDLDRMLTRYGDMRARADQSAAHHLALRAETLGNLASTDPVVHTTTSVLLAALANTARRYWDEWEAEAFRAFGSARERSRAAGHKTRAAEKHAHALPVDVPWLRRAFRNRCVYCAGKVDHIDHLWPLHLGGDDAPWNVAPACARCNLSKGARSLAEWWPGHWAGLTEAERVSVHALWDSLRFA